MAEQVVIYPWHRLRSTI